MNITTAHGAMFAALFILWSSQGVASPNDTPTLQLRLDNDLLGGLEQDQGYSHGVLLQWGSASLPMPCATCEPTKIDRYLGWLQPEQFDNHRLFFHVRQMLFTPKDRDASELVLDDRPFAGALMLGGSYATRYQQYLRVTELQLGLVGPDTKSKEFQHAWHDSFGVDRFRGWRHQLSNEPVLQFTHEQRLRPWRYSIGGHWRTDAIYHAGLSVGNFATYANMGAEWRIGVRLPDDMGSSALRPVGDNLSSSSATSEAWRGHFFVALDGRWVVRDITLDGNTFQRSHRVDKRSFVADIGYGLAVEKGHWRLAFSRYHRSREFDGQKETPVYGSVSVARRF